MNEDLRQAKAGDSIALGQYPQMASGADRTAIMWRVLDRADTALFLLSEKILDCKRYHAQFEDMTWQDCDLRHWLNDAFYHSAFSAAEQQDVMMTHCTNNGAGSPDTADKVFLLSITEVNTFTAMHGREAADRSRRAVGTPFAMARKADGCHLYVYDKSVEANYVIDNGRKTGCSWWWLRTQPTSASRAAFVGTGASVRSYCRVNRVSYGVRPALYLQL